MSLVTERVPMPLEWHPAYTDKTYLLDWLNGESGYPDDHVRVAFSKPLLASFDIEASFPTAPSTDTHTLTKRRCAGGAPYVGRPFVYAWWVATDELGRAIAADAEIVYRTDGLNAFRHWGRDPLSLPLRDDDGLG